MGSCFSQGFRFRTLPCGIHELVGGFSPRTPVSSPPLLVNGFSQRHKQFLSQRGFTYIYLSKSVPEIHWHVAGTLRVDTVVEDKLVFKLVKTTGHCSTVHGKFLIVLEFLVTTTSTDSLASKGTLDLVATLKQKLGKLVTTASPLNS